MSVSTIIPHCMLPADSLDASVTHHAPLLDECNGIVVCAIRSVDLVQMSYVLISLCLASLIVDLSRKGIIP